MFVKKKKKRNGPERWVGGMVVYVGGGGEMEVATDTTCHRHGDVTGSSASVCDYVSRSYRGLAARRRIASVVPFSCPAQLRKRCDP